MKLKMILIGEGRGVSQYTITKENGKIIGNMLLYCEIDKKNSLSVVKK